jgi:hypothetical protein
MENIFKTTQRQIERTLKTDWVKWNNNDPKSIKQAERKKARLENSGYNLRHQMINSITGECTFTYENC